LLDIILLFLQTAVDKEKISLSLIGMIEQILAISGILRFACQAQILISFCHVVVPLAHPWNQKRTIKTVGRPATGSLPFNIATARSPFEVCIVGIAPQYINLLRLLSDMYDWPLTSNGEPQRFSAQRFGDISCNNQLLLRFIVSFRR